jgi:hypothetical protein
MPYVAPESVLSPKGMVEDVEVIFDKGPEHGSWSIVKLKWNKNDAVGIRYNGDAEQSNLGLPQSRGIPTWFIVPDDIASAVLEAAKGLGAKKDDALIQGYRAMAADREREVEAEAWSEQMIGDGFEAR